jgi:hypothetical protein
MPEPIEHKFPANTSPTRSIFTPELSANLPHPADGQDSISSNCAAEELLFKKFGMT